MTLQRHVPAGGVQEFQWTEMPFGDIVLLSLESHRHLRVGEGGKVSADAPGAQFDGKNGATFTIRMTR
ncbi:MAG TPA: hypothetical protein VEH04_08740 [Verrucomicrobiae bacterium]|nr:hypothetical protein [Verrucomicrobiae bacterium]